MRALSQGLALSLAAGLFLFVPAGTVAWPMGWASLAVLFAGTVGLALLVTLRAPGLARERLRPAASGKDWDRLLTSAAKLLLVAGMLPVSGLDHRFGWSPDSPGFVSAVALLLCSLGFCIVGWAMMSNPFFSSIVRIQAERGHVVATAGPYRYIRHPGYLAMILQFMVMPVALGSFAASLPAALAACLYVARTALEDRTLQAELPGYLEYARRVRYRLLPRIW